MEAASMLLCSACGSQVELPANYCDMCGKPFVENLPALEASELSGPMPHSDPDCNSSPSLAGVNWKEPAIRIGIPVAVVASGIYLYQSPSKDAHTALLLLLPLMIGAIVAAANVEMTNGACSDINDWTVKKLQKFGSGEGKRHRFFFRPWHWLLSKVSSAIGSIENPSIRAGALIAAYLYIFGFFAFLAYVALAVIVALILMAIAFFIMGMFSGGGTPNISAPSKRGPRKHALKGTIVDEGFFVDTPSGMKIDEDGRLVEEGIFVDTPTGIKYSDDGNGGYNIVKEGIFGDTPTGEKINSEGRFVKEGIFGDSLTGEKINSEGQFVKEGIFGDKPTGRKIKRD